MAYLYLPIGNGLKYKDDGAITINADSNFTIDENGIYCDKGSPSSSDSGSQTLIDHWTVLPVEDTSTEELSITGNRRVVGKCYALSFLKTKRKYDNDLKSYVLLHKIPQNATSSDLKDGDDIVREINFPMWYPKRTNGASSAPFIAMSPGVLFVFSDYAYGTTNGTTRICETGARFSAGSPYDIAGEDATARQHIYAAFIATKVGRGKGSSKSYTYDGKTFNPSNFPNANPSGYRVTEELTLKCIWSDTTAFPVFNDTPGWKKGETLTGKLDLDNIYGRYTP